MQAHLFVAIKARIERLKPRTSSLRLSNNNIVVDLAQGFSLLVPSHEESIAVSMLGSRPLSISL